MRWWSKATLGVLLIVAVIYLLIETSRDPAPLTSKTSTDAVEDTTVESRDETAAPRTLDEPLGAAPQALTCAREIVQQGGEEGTAVTGIVVDAWTDRAVAGASIQFSRGRQPASEREWARDDLEAHLGPTTIAGADGRFRLEVPAAPNSIGKPSVVTLLAHAEGYPRQYFDEVPANAREARLSLKPGMRLSGRTVDEEGRPVAFASLELRVQSGLLGWLTSKLKSDADGTFVLDGVPSRSLVTVEINAAGFVPRLLRFWLKEPPGELTVKLSRGREITGRVIDGETREPIEGTSVGLWVHENVGHFFGTRALQHMKTGGDGGYRFEHVEALEGLERDSWRNHPLGRPLGRPPGSRCLGLWVDAAGYAPAWVAIDFGRSQEIELFRSGAIEGRVLNVRGEPMSGARVVARTRPAMLVRAASLPSRHFDSQAREPWACLWAAVTGADGHYRIERVASPPASGRIVKLNVESRKLPHGQADVVVVPGETVTAPPLTNPDPLSAWITGRTVDEAGEPVVGVLVRVGATGRAHSGDDGRFRIPYPVPDVRGSKRVPMFLSHCDFVSRTVPISRAWQDGSEVLIRLERGIRLSGTVVDRNGRGIAGASIRVRRGHDPISVESGLTRILTEVVYATSRDEGTFSLGPISLGPIQMLVAYPDRFRGPFCTRLSLSAVAGAGTLVLSLPTLDMAAYRPVILRIRVVDETTGETVRQPLSADLLSEEGLWRGEVKGADGSIVIQEVPAPLEYELRLRVRGFGAVSHRISVSSCSDVCEHVIAIGGGGSVLRGRIVGADRVPKFPQVVVTAASGDRTVVSVEADGRFEVRGLEASTYVVDLDTWRLPEAQRVIAAPARVTVPAQGTAEVELTVEKAGMLYVNFLPRGSDPGSPEPVVSGLRPPRSSPAIDRWKRRGISIFIRDRAGRTWYRGTPNIASHQGHSLCEIPILCILVAEGVYNVTALRNGEVIARGNATTGTTTWIRADFTDR